MGRSRRLLVGILALVVGLSVLTGTATALRLRGSGDASPAGSNSAARSGRSGFLSALAGAVSGLVGGGRTADRPHAGHIRLAYNQQPPKGVRLKPATRVKELVAKRSATTRVFAMSDGRLQAEVSSAPRFYRDAKGAWQPINTAVSPAAADGYALANTTNTFTSRFGASTTKLARFELGGQQVTLGLAGPDRPLSPQVSRDMVTYAGIAPGVDLSYQVTTQELKERLVLRDAAAGAALAKLTFTLDAGALTVASRKDGSVELRAPETGQVLLVMPAPFMMDSHADAASPYGYSASRKVAQKLARAGSGYAMTVTADHAWLADPKRAFPVTVDPTIKIQPTVSQSQDAMIVNDGPNANYNGNWKLSVGTTPTEVARSLVKFDLSTIPQNTTIDSASLQMYFDQDFATSSYDVPMEARQVTAPWDQSTVTWNSINTSYGTGAATVVQVDDTDTAKIAMKGSWPASTTKSETRYAINSTFRYNKDTVAGDTFTWVPTLPADGSYTVDAHYVTGSNRSTGAQYTVTYNGGSKTTAVNQQTPGSADWATLGTYPFVAGTMGKVVLGDATVTSTTEVVADAVRFTQAGAVKKANESNVWHSYPATNLVQSWLNGTTPNYGFMLKAVDETTMNHGGPRYEAAEYAYNGENENTPKLIVNYGKPGVTLDAPTTIYSTGAALHWSAYAGSDIAEYQVHRSIYQTFTPTAATLVAPVDKGTTSFTDTTATPTPVDSTDPFGQVYYYMIVVKTTDGTLIPAPTQIVRLPRAGHVTQIIQGGADDTTLSSAQPDTPQNSLAGNPWLMVGDSSATYGKTRAVVHFDTSMIPSDAKVLSTTFNLWSFTEVGAVPGTATYEVHALTKPFDQATATWNSAATGTTWSTAGGDFSATVPSTVTQMSNDPAWRGWTVDTIVQNWINGSAPNDGLEVKLANESTPQERTIFLSSEAAEPQLRPELVVNYTEPTPAQTYYAPTTQSIRMIPNDQYTIPVTLNNATSSTWAAGDWQLSYHWTLPDGTDVTTGGNQAFTALPSDVASAADVNVNATVKTPINSDTGNKASQYILKWDLYNKTTSTWLSSAGIGTLDQPVTVDDPTSNELGMEKFYQYAAIPTGSGGTALVNAHAGNVAWGYNAFSNPGRGLNTSVRITYNSEDTSNSSMGFGWSLSGSTLTRLGSPLQFHPPGQDWPTEVRMTDGDGTTHLFTLNKHGSTDTSVWDYDHPAGVHLYLQKNSAAGDPTRAWVMTAPDRTQFFFDADGYPSAVVDHTGNNTQTFTYANRKSNNEPIKFLQYVTDPWSRQTLTLTYYAKGDDYSYIDDNGNLVNDTNLTNPKIIDQVKSMTDIGGRTITFTYTTKGLMARMVDGAGTNIAKTFNFAYDMTQGNKNVKLVQVTDPRGNATKFAYYDPPDNPQFHWWAKSIIDRGTGESDFSYTANTDGSIQTSVRDPNGNSSAYATDGYGRPTAVTNAKQQTTQMLWEADNNVQQLTEFNQAVTKYTYDPVTGYPLTIQDAEAVNHGWPSTVLTYNTGLNGHIADLATKTSPEGREWSFGYDAVGNLTSVTDPAGTATSTAGDYTTTYAYDTYGQLQSATDANGHATRYNGFDPTGYPTIIIDAKNHETDTTYDAWGHVKSVTDALKKTSSYHYDIFGRPLDHTVPIKQDAGRYQVTPAPSYDGNDNVTSSTAPNGAVTTAVYDANDLVTSVTAPKDASTGPDRVTSYTYDKVGNVLTRTEPDGNLTSTAGDYTTTYGYDAIYETTSVTDANGGLTTYGYDEVGNVTTVVDPLKNLTSDTSDYTTKYAYDLDHRVTVTTDAAGKTASKTYDKDGKVTSTTDLQGNKTLLSLDARGKVTQVQVPHAGSNGTISYNTTKYSYDQVGNTTRVESPRGVATTNDANDYVTDYTYDELNRVQDQILPYASSDQRYNTPDKVTKTYDAVGRLAAISSPPSNGQTVRNVTAYTYFDNGWVETSTDPWSVLTSYDYNSLGQQSSRTLTSAGGSSSRAMSWDYYPDGKLKSRTDSGVPVGLNVVLVDNSDSQNTTSTGTWTASSDGTGFQGYDYRTHAAGTGTNTFTWNLTVEQAGTYTVYAKYPVGTATNATYTVNHGGTSSPVTVDQTRNAGTWVSLGSYSFAQGTTDTISLSDNANGTVNADAVKLVRDNSGDSDTEQKTFGYAYDANGNLTTLTDNSSGALVDTYAVAYDGLNRVTSVAEQKSGVTQHTTGFGYDADGNVTSRTHDSEQAAYVYDTLNQLTKITDATSASDPSPKVTTYGYTDNGWRQHEVKANGNTVDYSYFLDGLLQHQIEKKSDGTLVAEHTLDYDPNSNRTSDVAKVMNADNHAATLDTSTTYTYDPRDRVASVTKTNTDTGATLSTESYIHDANSNVVQQTVGGANTSYNYDRNRLLSATTNGSTANYNYDPFGRLDTITSGGSVLQSYTYDGFDHIASEKKNTGTSSTTSQFTYDPLNRTATRTDNAGSTSAKTTTYAYLGLSNDLISEQAGGKVQKSYQYSPSGQRLSQTTTNSDGTTEDAYYGYNPHTDVETLTDSAGNTKATYGYTAYGSNDTNQFTGIDKPDTSDPTKQPYNAYRFNAKRWDPVSGNYDMGFRNYSPGLNQFLSRDMYEGALSDMRLSTNPWTSNRYAFAGGNPISGVELDGHMFDTADGGESGSSGCTSDATCSRMMAENEDGSVQYQDNDPVTGMARPPTVTNQKLQNILNNLYIRPDEKTQIDGDGKLSTAVRYELRTGKAVGGKWHINKAADSFKGLMDLLNDPSANLTPAERAAAEGEAADLLDAITAKDEKGGVNEELTNNPGRRTNLRNAMKKALRSGPARRLGWSGDDYDWVNGRPQVRPPTPSAGSDNVPRIGSDDTCACGGVRPGPFGPEEPEGPGMPEDPLEPFIDPFI